MWIRSQDKKTLVDAGSLFANNLKVFAYDKASVAYTLGEYETQERALEVLDEIQKHIVSLELARKGNHFENLARDCYSAYEFERRSEAICIYQMPEE